jgi:hypothetical protein
MTVDMSIWSLSKSPAKPNIVTIWLNSMITEDSEDTDPLTASMRVSAIPSVRNMAEKMAPIKRDKSNFSSLNHNPVSEFEQT